MIVVVVYEFWDETGCLNVVPLANKKNNNNKQTKKKHHYNNSERKRRRASGVRDSESINKVSNILIPNIDIVEVFPPLQRRRQRGCCIRHSENVVVVVVGVRFKNREGVEGNEIGV